MRIRTCSFVFALLLLALPSLGQSLNPKAIAQLRWYQTNQAGIFTLPAYSGLSLGFDGKNIWEGASGDNVYKIRVSDGAILGNYSVQNGPQGMAYDGENMWVANYNTNSLSKIRASDGKNLGNITVGDNPMSPVFDGTNIFIVNYGSRNIMVIRPSDGAILYTTTPTSAPEYLVFDGTNVWVTDYSVNEIVKLTSTGAYGGFISTPDSVSTPFFDGTYLWVSDRTSSHILKLDRSTLSIVSSYSVGDEPYISAFDGYSLWVRVLSASTPLVKVRVSDGTVVSTFSTPIGAPQGPVVFDGVHVWVDCASSGNQLCKM